MARDFNIDLPIVGTVKYVADGNISDISVSKEEIHQISSRKSDEQKIRLKSINGIVTHNIIISTLHRFGVTIGMSFKCSIGKLKSRDGSCEFL